MVADVTGSWRATVQSWSAFLAAHRSDWLQLAETVRAAPDLAPQWFEALIYGHEFDPADLKVVAAFRDGRLGLVWPFRVVTHRVAGWRFQTIAPLQNVFCLHGGVLVAAQCDAPGRLLLGALRLLPEHWVSIALDSVVADSSAHRDWLAAAREARLPIAAASVERPPYLPLEGSWDGYLRSRSANFRANIKRRLRRIGGEGAVELRFYTNADEVPEYMQHLERIEARTWKHAEGTAITSRPWERRFYERLALLFADDQRWHGAVLSLDGVPIAYEFLLVSDGHVYGLKHSFDAGQSALAPGKVLHAQLLEHFYAAGGTEFDFLGKDEPHKLEWTASTREHLSLRIFSSGLLGRFAYMLMRLRRRLGAARAWGRRLGAKSPE